MLQVKALGTNGSTVEQTEGEPENARGTWGLRLECARERRGLYMEEKLEFEELKGIHGKAWENKRWFY